VEEDWKPFLGDLGVGGIFPMDLAFFWWVPALPWSSMIFLASLGSCWQLRMKPVRHPASTDPLLPVSPIS